MDSFPDGVGDRVWPRRGGGGALSKGGRYLPREEGVAPFIGSQAGRDDREWFRRREVTKQGLVDLFRGFSVRQLREPGSDSPHSELLRSPYSTWRCIRQEGFPMMGLRSLDCLEVSLFGELGYYPVLWVIRGAGLPRG